MARTPKKTPRINLEALKNPYGASCDKNGKMRYYYTKEKYLEIEAALKAFEIISEKNVAITMIKQTQSVKEYNLFAYDFLQIKRVDEEKYKLSPQPLTQAEFDLLKEVLL